MGAQKSKNGHTTQPHRILVTLPEDDTALLDFLSKFAARRKRSALILFAVRLTMALLDNPGLPLPDPEDVARQIIQNMVQSRAVRPAMAASPPAVAGTIKVTKSKASDTDLEDNLAGFALDMFS